MTAWRLQWQPWRWKEGPELAELKETLEHHFRQPTFLYESGRSGLLSLLQAIGIGAGDEVIVPGYTCVVVPNAVLAAGGVPIYCDTIPQHVVVDPAEVAKKISPQTKAIICQHTFGHAANAKELRRLCDEHSIHLIEDCAHVLPSAERNIGIYGHSIMLSFGRDKALSGVSGGAIITKDKELAYELEREQAHLTTESYWKICQYVHYPLFYQAAKSFWKIGLGRWYLRLIGLLKVLPKITTTLEKCGKMDTVSKKMPNACAILVLQQWKERGRIQDHRSQLTAWYQAHCTKLHPIGTHNQSCPLQKFSLLVKNQQTALETLKDKDIFLQDGWSGSVINPPDVELPNMLYTKGSCPHAEDVARHIISLPTHPTTSILQAALVLDAVENLVDTSL